MQVWTDPKKVLIPVARRMKENYFPATVLQQVIVLNTFSNGIVTVPCGVGLEGFINMFRAAERVIDCTMGATWACNIRETCAVQRQADDADYIDIETDPRRESAIMVTFIYAKRRIEATCLFFIAEDNRVVWGRELDCDNGPDAVYELDPFLERLAERVTLEVI